MNKEERLKLEKHIKYIKNKASRKNMQKIFVKAIKDYFKNFKLRKNYLNYGTVYAATHMAYRAIIKYIAEMEFTDMRCVWEIKKNKIYMNFYYMKPYKYWWYRIKLIL